MQATLDKHEKEDAIVLDGLWYDDVGRLCMMGQLDKVAEHVVRLGSRKRSQDEMVEMLRSRLKPIVQPTML